MTSYIHNFHQYRWSVIIIISDIDRNYCCHSNAGPLHNYIMQMKAIPVENVEVVNASDDVSILYLDLLGYTGNERPSTP